MHRYASPDLDLRGMQPVLTTARPVHRLIWTWVACNQCSLQRARCLPRPQGAIIERQRIQTELEKVFAREPWGKEVLPLVGPLALRSLQEIKGGKRPVAMSAPSGTAETADILMTPAWHACAHNGVLPPVHRHRRDCGNLGELFPRHRK